MNGFIVLMPLILTTFSYSIFGGTVVTKIVLFVSVICGVIQLYRCYFNYMTGENEACFKQFKTYYFLGTGILNILVPILMAVVFRFTDTSISITLTHTLEQLMGPVKYLTIASCLFGLVFLLGGFCYDLLNPNKKDIAKVKVLVSKWGGTLICILSIYNMFLIKWL